jgi:hypothetical protein
MTKQQSPDWSIGSKDVAKLEDATGDGAVVREMAPSPDGKRLALVLQLPDDTMRVWVNGEVWEPEFEKAWHLRFTPDGRALVLVRQDDQWSVALDGQVWEERFDYAWNPKITPNGHVGVQIKRDNQYSVAIDGTA